MNDSKYKESNLIFNIQDNGGIVNIQENGIQYDFCRTDPDCQEDCILNLRKIRMNQK